MLFDLIEGSIDAAAVAKVGANADCLATIRGDLLNNRAVVVRIAAENHHIIRLTKTPGDRCALEWVRTWLWTYALEAYRARTDASDNCKCLGSHS